MEPEHLQFVLLLNFVHFVSLWVPCWFFLALTKLRLCERYKISRDRPDMDPSLPKNVALDKEAFSEQLVGTFVLVPLISYFGYYPLKQCGMPLSLFPLPSPSVCLLHMLLLIVLCDALFYWTHRTLHHPLLYATLHKKHHFYKGTNVYASEYFGVVDFVLNVLPGVLPAVLLRVDLLTFLLFTAARGWQTVQSHAGYDLPFDPLNRGVFAGGARRHDFHHSHNVGCYGDWTPFWDWLCGTDREYRKHYERVKKQV